MRKSLRSSLAALALIGFGTTACYHTTVDTGRAPNGTVIHKAWAHSFINGLVPPATVETASQCPNGVAKVETQMSFLNMLVGALTFGIYTPMDITVQCAGPGGAASITVPEGATQADLAAAIGKAAEQSAQTQAPVYVAF